MTASCYESALASDAFTAAAKTDPVLCERLKTLTEQDGKSFIAVNLVRMNIGGYPMLSCAASIKQGDGTIIGMSNPMKPPAEQQAAEIHTHISAEAAAAALAKVR